MDILIGHCKPDSGGKSPGSFNGESGDEVTRPQSLLFHAAGKIP